MLGFGQQPVNTGGRTITILLFADDNDTLAGKEDGGTLGKDIYDMEINAQMTKLMNTNDINTDYRSRFPETKTASSFKALNLSYQMKLKLYRGPPKQQQKWQSWEKSNIALSIKSQTDVLPVKKRELKCYEHVA